MFLEPGRQFIINTALFFSLFAFQFSIFIPLLHSKPRDYNTRRRTAFYRNVLQPDEDSLRRKSFHRYRIDERYRSCLIIPLSLQMLVENAIKHNTISKRHPLTITVEDTTFSRQQSVHLFREQNDKHPFLRSYGIVV